MIIRVCLAAALVMMPAAAVAQGNPGPYGRLFGTRPLTDGAEHTTIDVRSTLGAQYDNALLAAEGETQDTALDSGVSGGATLGLFFEHTSSRFTVGLRGGVSRQEYFRKSEPFGVNLFYADGRVSAKLTTRLRAEAAAGYVHSPYFQFFQNFGQTSVVAHDDGLLTFSPYATRMLENETVDLSAGLVSQLTKRSTLNGSVYRRQTRFARQPDDDFVLDGYRAAWHWQLRRDLGVHAGYGREHADHKGDGRVDYDNEIVDVGVDFNRALSLSRRTSLGFSTSTSFIKNSSSDRQFRLNGAVTLSKHFRRTWRAVAQASRSTEFLPGFVEPILSDTVGISLAGMFTRRLHWMASAASGQGQYGFSDRTGFSTVTAGSRLSVALSKNVGLFGQYAAYWYDIPADSTTLQLPGHLARQTVSVGLTAHLPVYNNTRQQ